MKHVGLVFIGTSKYADFFPFWYQGVQDYLFDDCKKTVFALSDRCDEGIFDKPDVVLAEIEHAPWPHITLNRFDYIRQLLSTMKSMGIDYVLFLDADLFAQKKLSFSDVFSDDKPLVGVMHPGKIDNPNWHSFVVKGESRANVLKHAGVDIETISEQPYRQGCLWGGTYEEVSVMCNNLSEAIKDDYNRDIIADWHDESHMNCWFMANKDKVHTLPASYAFPDQKHWHSVLGEAGYEPVMLHIDKPMTEYPRFKGASPQLSDEAKENFREAYKRLGLWPLVCHTCGKKAGEEITFVTAMTWFLATSSTDGKTFAVCEACANASGRTKHY